MRIDKQKYMTGLIMLFSMVLAPSLSAQGYSIAPLPSWVNPVATPTSDHVGQQNNSYGVAYLLVDHQWQINTGQQKHYRHFVDEALNTSGVSELSQISIEFDPVYESVVLHQVIIHRDGKILNRIDRSKISLLQREKDLEHQIYDGTQTLNLLIEDVRSGDRVEYSYTIEGANPVFAGHFAEHLKMRWGVPVARVQYRLLWPSSRKLYIQNHETEIEPVKSVSGAFTEYVWHEDNIEELVSDNDIPSWYDPFPVIYLSDIASWREVADWAWPLYRPLINSPAQKAVIASILATTSTDEQRALAALRFVQNEVRYLGIEMGARSHEPSAPDTVLQQRFGDCKDKSRLLVSLLQGMGIQASSALVNTYSGIWLKETLPTPTVFNHAIVLARLNEKNFWLDPTRNYQNGALDAVYQPDYDYALVVSDQNSDLIKMSDDITTVHSKLVEESFDIRDALDKPTSYHILTHHQGYYADSVRASLAETNLNQVQQTYLNYTALYYSDIQLADKLSFVDDETLNKLTLNEQYTIPKIWQESEDERYILVNFEPFLIIDNVKNLDSPIRTMPYAVTHPIRFQHITRIQMPADSGFSDELIEVEDKAFRFIKKVSFLDNVLELDYVFESLSDHVLPEDIQTYSSNIRKVQNLASYQVSMSNPAINLGEYSFDANDLNWPLVIILFLAVAGTLFLSVKYIYLYDPPYRAPAQINPKLTGLGGWLLLPGLALIVSPIRIVFESEELWYVFSALQWSIVEDKFGSGLLILVAVELICNVAMIVAALFLIILFFAKRHTLPRLFIIYFVFSFVVFGADLLAVHLLAYPGVEVAREDLGELARIAFFTTIWSLYFLNSERVKATFTQQRKRPVPVSNAADSELKVILQNAD